MQKKFDFLIILLLVSLYLLGVIGIFNYKFVYPFLILLAIDILFVICYFFYGVTVYWE